MVLFYDWASLFQMEKGADARILQKRSRDEDEAFVHASKAYCILDQEASSALCGCFTLGGVRMANTRKGMDDDSRASLFQVEKGADGRIQQKRSRDEDEAFVHALKTMMIWYVHRKLIAFLITKLPARCADVPI